MILVPRLEPEGPDNLELMTASVQNPRPLFFFLADRIRDKVSRFAVRAFQARTDHALRKVERWRV